MVEIKKEPKDVNLKDIYGSQEIIIKNTTIYNTDNFYKHLHFTRSIDSHLKRCNCCRNQSKRLYGCDDSRLRFRAFCPVCVLATAKESKGKEIKLIKNGIKG